MDKENINKNILNLSIVIKLLFPCFHLQLLATKNVNQRISISRPTSVKQIV